jgi:hypothetical protein
VITPLFAETIVSPVFLELLWSGTGFADVGVGAAKSGGVLELTSLAAVPGLISISPADGLLTVLSFPSMF